MWKRAFICVLLLNLICAETTVEPTTRRSLGVEVAVVLDESHSKQLPEAVKWVAKRMEGTTAQGQIGFKAYVNIIDTRTNLSHALKEILNLATSKRRLSPGEEMGCSQAIFMGESRPCLGKSG